MRHMRSFPRSSLVVALLLAPVVPTRAGPSTTASPSVTVTDEAKPPPGSREDQALWRSGLETQTTSLVEQERARALVREVGAGRYDARLTEIAKAGAPVSRRAEDLAEKLARSADATHRAGAARPFNPVTGCKYELLHLQQAMAAKPRSPGAADLPDSRQKLAMCRDRLRAWAGPLTQATDRLAATLDEVRSFLASDEAKALDPVTRASQTSSGR